MKILIVTPFPISPLCHGGRVRTYRLATGLARAGATVDVLFPWQLGLPLRPFRREGVIFHPHAFIANALPRLLGDRLVPSLVALSWQPFTLGPRRRLRMLGACDIVQFEFCAQAAWMEQMAAGARVVYSAHNVEYDFLRTQPGQSILRGTMLRRLAALERRAVQASTVVVTCTASDSQRLTELYGAGPQFEVIPHGLDESLLTFDRTRLRERSRASLGITPDQLAILFVGGAAQHNREAVRFLEREVMPRLGRRATLLIAGDCSNASRSRDGRDPAVRPLGFVKDLQPFYAAADVGVNPVMHGSGSSVKIIDYLAAGLPVVTTPAGMRGYEHLRDRLSVTEFPNFAAAVSTFHPVASRGTPPLGSMTWSALGERLYSVYAQLCRAVPGVK